MSERVELHRLAELHEGFMRAFDVGPLVQVGRVRQDAALHKRPHIDQFMVARVEQNGLVGECGVNESVFAVHLLVGRGEIGGQEILEVQHLRQMQLQRVLAVSPRFKGEVHAQRPVQHNVT